MATEDIPNGEKRTDVGYKNPPVEHRFSADNQPLRRKKRTPRSLHPAEILMKILAEEHRVEINGKVFWYTKGRLLIMTAFKLAEKGNPTLSRNLADLLFKDADASLEDETWLQIQQPDDTWVTTTMKGGPVNIDDWASSWSA